MRSVDVRDRSLRANGLQARQLLAGAPGAPGPQGPKGDRRERGAPATRLFANVTDTGELAPVHQGATAATRRPRGAYRVTFNRDLIGCVAFAAVGLAAGTSGMLQTDTIADANILRSDPRQVDVFLVHGSPPAQVDGSFNIAVLCE